MVRRKPKAIILDLDGTSRIAHSGYGNSLYHQQRFAEAMEHFMAKASQINVILLSARPARFKALTEEWLAKNNIHYDQLILSNYPELTDPEFKLKMYRELIEPYADVIFTVDDRDTVVRMWREIGLTCLDIAGNHFS